MSRPASGRERTAPNNANTEPMAAKMAVATNQLTRNPPMWAQRQVPDAMATTPSRRKTTETATTAMRMPESGGQAGRQRLASKPSRSGKRHQPTRAPDSTGIARWRRTTTFGIPKAPVGKVYAKTTSQQRRRLPAETGCTAMSRKSCLMRSGKFVEAGRHWPC